MAQKTKRIPIKEDTFVDLGEFKGSGETWDDVIKSLMEAQRKQNLREMLERTDKEEYVPLDEV